MLPAPPRAGSPCPLAIALDSIGSKWSLRVLYELAITPRRFNELQRLNEVSPTRCSPRRCAVWSATA